MLLPTHNIVLAFEERLSSNLVKFAQSNFEEISDGYCLSDQAIPHVTLSQVNLHDFSNIKGLQKELLNINLNKVVLCPTSFSFRYGYNDHEGFIWVEIGIRKSRDLVEAHKKVCEVLFSYDLKPLNAYGGEYHPHITFCRVRLGSKTPEMQFETFLTQTIEGSFLAFGESDHNGQLLNILWKDENLKG